MACACQHPRRDLPGDGPAAILGPWAGPVLIVLSVAVGCVGGIYGIDGGSILALILIGSGRRADEVAPAALASTFVTSVGGVITFTILSINQYAPVAPNWPTGIALGAGGLAGGRARRSRPRWSAGNWFR